MTDTAWRPVFACPTCARVLANGIPDRLECVVCRTSVDVRGGIYRFLSARRLEELRPFFDQYRHVRARDGYRPAAGRYYRALPHVEAGDPQAEAWRLRACTYRHFVEQVVDRLPVRSATVLDLGAGSGWLSHRVSSLGHSPVAVDWLDDDADGLGAWKFYDRRFLCVEAEFDRLPFPPRQFDIVVFNGSLHYAAAVEATLRLAADQLAPGGSLVVMDSPMFTRARDGEAMVAEKHRRFRTIYGMSAIVRPGAGYVTFGELEGVARDLGLRTRFAPSRAGLAWPLKRWVAGLKIGRQPAAFGLWVAR